MFECLLDCYQIMLLHNTLHGRCLVEFCPPPLLTRQPDPDDQDLSDVHERLRPVQERVFLATGLESRARRC